MSIRARLLLLILFATLIPALVGGFQFLERRDAEIADAQRDLAATAQRVAQGLRDTVRATAQLHYGLSRARDLDTQDQAACSAFLADVLREYPQYTGILTIKPDGRLFCDSLQTGRQLNLTDRRYFQDALHSGNPLAVEAVFGRLTGMAVLQIAYAARRENAAPDFILLASLNLEKYMQAQAQFLPRKTAVMALMDSKGTILTWDPAGAKLRGTSIADSQLYRFANEGQGGHAREFTGVGGATRIWATSPLPEFPGAGLHVLVGVAKEDLLAAANRNLGQALASLAVVSLLVFAGAWALVELAIRRQATRIITAVTRFSGGDFHVRIGKPYPRGEIGGLMAALDQAFELTQAEHWRVVHGAEALAYSNRRLKMLSESNHALVEALDEGTLLQAVCRIVVEFGGYCSCLVGYAEQDAEKSLRPVAQAGPEGGSLETLDPTWADQERSRGLMVRAIRGGVPVLEQSVAAAPDPPCAAGPGRAVREGYGALLALPIKSNGQIVGALAIAAAQPHRFDEREVKLLLDLATDLGYGIHALRNRAELEHHRDQLEQLVDQRTARLADANRELESFSYSVSHDLRAPLRHINGYVQLLAGDSASTLTPKARRYLNVIAEASRQMGQLIDDLLEFSRMSRTEMHETQVDLGALVHHGIRDLELFTQGRNIAWKVAPLPAVTGDPAMLKLVFANLLGNAVKYTRPREAAEIEVGCAGEESGWAIVFVRDNGVGFDMRYVDKLFGVFQRLHRADEFEGTGIGLANVSRIIARHGGRVWAEGRVGEGATFYFTLRPIEKPVNGKSP